MKKSLKCYLTKYLGQNVVEIVTSIYDDFSLTGSFNYSNISGSCVFLTLQYVDRIARKFGHLECWAQDILLKC